MLDALLRVLHDNYGLTAIQLKPLEGYDSQNYRVDSDQGRYVLKLYIDHPNVIRDVSAENAVLEHLKTKEPFYPTVILNHKGEGLTISGDHGQKYSVYRLLSFLEGTFWGDAVISEELYRSLGQFMGVTDRLLQSLSPTEYKAKRIPWDLDHFLMNENLIEHIENQSQRKLVEYFFLQYKEKVQPNLYQLRKGLIHNDANDWNILTDGDQVSGLIDFGDMVYSSVVNEVSVALTYALMSSDNISRHAAMLVSSYHKIYPIEEREIDVIYYLIAARLCTSVCQSAYTKKQKPDSAYITVSEKPAWDLLNRWISIHPLAFANTLRQACGYVPNKGRDSKELLAKRKQYLSSALSLSYHEPFHMVGAAFQYMYDADDNAILDAYNNIIHVGHCHPHVVRSGQQAMATLNTNTRYLYDSLTNYAERLLSLFPDSLSKVFFVNSGSAASDLAIRMAMTHTQKHKVAVVKHGYHGNSRMGIDISHYKYDHKGGAGRQSFIIEADLPDAYRGVYRDRPDAGTLYASDFINQIKGESDLAAFIAEPIVGCGGQVPLADGYLKALYPQIRKAGAVCISDEVQVGFGRLGSHFWGFEMHDVIPDIVILGKPIGNGHPMAAVVCTDEIAKSFDNGMEFFSSFGGNPVSCAIGLAVLEVIEREGLQAHALEVGNYMMDRLRTLATKYFCIGDVRGAGLFIGVDIVKDGRSRQSDRYLAAHIKNQMRQHHILISTDGPDDNVIKIKAPLCFSKDNVDHLIQTMDYILSEM